MDERERVYVAGPDHPELLDVLKVGERVVVCDDELEMEAIIEYRADHGWFVGLLDLSTLKFLLSDDGPTKKQAVP